jgi:hypothetical protein
MSPAQIEPLAADLLHGAQEIADFLGIPTASVFYQVARGQIPVTRMGRLIIASKTTLRRHFAPELARETTPTT